MRWYRYAQGRDPFEAFYDTLEALEVVGANMSGDQEEEWRDAATPHGEHTTEGTGRIMGDAQGAVTLKGKLYVPTREGIPAEEFVRMVLQDEVPEKVQREVEKETHPVPWHEYMERDVEVDLKLSKLDENLYDATIQFYIDASYVFDPDWFA